MTLGLDLSTKNSGYGLFDDKKNLVDYGEIKATSADVINRCYKMRDEIKKVLEKYQEINKIILEEVLPTGQNPVVWKALMKLQSCILFMLHDNYPNIRIEYILPNSWRAKIGIKTGRGVTRATLKKKDIDFVQDNFGILCGDDAADGILIAYSSFIEDKSEKEYIFK